MKGRLITLEGIDGVGKTTHAAQLAEFLRARGLTVVSFREPGSTPLGEQLRLVLKSGVTQSALGELLLFAAARAELVATRIRPALASGHYVILDRFTDSTLAYQGALERIAEGSLRAVCEAACDGLWPDVTFWLDLSPDDALNRRFPLTTALSADGVAARAEPDAIEQRDRGYFNRVRERYRAICEANLRRVVRIDASGPVEETQRQVREGMSIRLEEWRDG